MRGGVVCRVGLDARDIVVSGVQTISVRSADDGVRLDRWFKKHFPDVTNGRLQKWLRTGQVRVDGGRAKTSNRVHAGQIIRVPPVPMPSNPQERPKITARIDEHRAEELRQRILYRDDDMLIIDKPSGLAVQGGSKTTEHLDAYLDELRFDGDERPRLVHRLDKDTSGTLVLARSGKAARWLTAAFRGRETRKLYWAVVVGQPNPSEGLIDTYLDKRRAGGVEKMAIVDKGDGQRAQSVYREIARSGRVAAWLAMEPLTGRTHQLRVHAADVLGTPILGDGKYGGPDAYVEGGGVSRLLHLHARGIRVPRPGRSAVEAFAPLPPHMAETFGFLGFTENEAEPGFLES